MGFFCRHDMDLKVILKQSREILYKKLNDFFSEKRYIPREERKEHVIVVKLLGLLGYTYYLFKNGQERFRIRLYKLRDDIESFRIVYEIGLHSRKLLFTSVLTLLASVFIYFFIYSFSFQLSVESVRNLLLAYFAGITALLGIIFAFYSVGFQIATSKFSSEVTDYINHEKVGNYFFKLLVFSGIFSLVVAVIQHGVTFPLIVPLIIATVLVIFSLLGILIFKDDYITKLNSQSIFQSIYTENIRALKEVNKYHTPSISSFRLTRNPNVSSFRLHLETHKSWSIVMTLQKLVEKRMRIHKILFKDLVRQNSLDDASHGIMLLGYFFNSYLEIKHFIDSDKGWWFPTYQELVRADNMSMFPLKANYESKGIGRMGTTKQNDTWLEDTILNNLKEIQNDKELINSPKIVNALIYSYETILAGRFERTKKGMQKTVRGVYELQDFQLAEKVLASFFELGNKLTDEGTMAEYLNAFGQIKTTISDGFSLREFPGQLAEWKPSFNKSVKALYQGKKLLQKKDGLIELHLPKYFHLLLTSYQEQIQAEYFAEKRIVTPEEWLLKESEKVASTYEKEIVEKFTFLLLDGLFSLQEKSQMFQENIPTIIFALFNQLISSGQWEFLEKIIIKYKAKLAIAFAKVSTDKFLELELREPIEFGTFASLVRRKKIVFIFFLRLYFLAQLHINHKVDRTNAEELLRTARRPLMIGALAYLVSELDDDFYYVTQVTKLSEPLFPQADLASVFETTKKMKVALGMSTLSQIIHEESSRYRHFYRRVINSIFDLPPDWISHGGMFAGSTQTVKHKSKFIRRMGEFELSDMDECFDGYIEWLEKREKIKSLVNVLQRIKEKNEKT